MSAARGAASPLAAVMTSDLTGVEDCVFDPRAGQKAARALHGQRQPSHDPLVDGL